MSEQKPMSFMQELERWSQAAVIEPLLYAGAQSAGEGGDADWQRTAEQVKKAIRTKVLESYHNGQKAPSKLQAAMRYRR